jgi:hypothetical protein
MTMAIQRTIPLDAREITTNATKSETEPHPRWHVRCTLDGCRSAAGVTSLMCQKRRPSWTAARLGTHRADRRLRLEHCRSIAGRCAQTAAAAAISAGGLSSRNVSRCRTLRALSCSDPLWQITGSFSPWRKARVGVDTRAPRSDLRPMMTLDQCASCLADLSRSGVYSERRIDDCVNSYLAGFSVTQTATMRQELARLFSGEASISELSDRIRDRILRRDP